MDVDVDGCNEESPIYFGDMKKTKFDSKNQDTIFPKEYGQYVPVLRYLNDKNRGNPRIRDME